MGMVQRIKILPDIHIENPTDPMRPALTPYATQRFMSRSPRPKPIREALEVLLVDRFQQHDNRTLEHFVGNGWHPDWAGFLAVAFGYLYPKHGRRDIRPALGLIEQVLQVLFQVLAVFRPSLTIDARCAVRSDPFVGCLQPFHIQIVVQRREHLLRSFPRYLRYPLLYRVHVF